jgi:RNA polymerase sigma factor (sigma-70 family)
MRRRKRFRRDWKKDLSQLSDQELSDEILYQRCADGDDDALSSLLERHGESLALFIYGIVGSMEDAEDLMLDAFAQISADRGRFQRRSSFRTYLFAIGRNLACKSIRKKHPVFTPLEEETVSAGEAGDPDARLIKLEENQRLYQGLAGIPFEYALALYLIFFESMSYAETARVMRKTEKQVANLACRGKNALKEILEKDGYQDGKL